MSGRDTAVLGDQEPASARGSVTARYFLDVLRWALALFVAGFCLFIMGSLAIAGVAVLGIASHSAGDTVVPASRNPRDSTMEIISVCKCVESGA